MKTKTTTRATTATTQASAMAQIEAILNAAPRRTAHTDKGATKRLENASETTGLICRAGLLTSDTAPALMANDLLATMRPFFYAFLNGQRTKDPAIKKAELAAENLRLKAQIEALTAKA